MARPRPLRPLLVALILLLPAGPLAAQEELRTGAEESGFERHTSYEEMMSFLRAARASSTDMRLAFFGETHQGRALPYAIFSRPAVTQPWEAMASGKPIVVLAANVHGNERTLRESLLALVRELAAAGTAANALLDDLVILVAPSLNPDGFEATDRGIRGNSWGLDMNRDYMKLEQPAIASFVGKVVQRWHPHLLIDGHNGGSYPYNLNYQCTSNAGADPALTRICDQEIFPAIDAAMEAHGYRSFYYASGTETRWETGGFDARIGRNYGGLANAIAILFESPRGQSLRTGVESGVVAFRTVLEYVRDNSGRVMATVNDARWETVRLGEAAAGDVPVEQTYGPEPWSVTYTVASEQGRNAELRTVTSDSLMKRPIPTRVRARPYAYLLPRDAVAAVALLRRHNITVEVLEDSVTLEVEAYGLEAVQFEEAYNHGAAVRVTAGEAITASRTFPAGTYVVPTGQILGRLVTHMLEPETNDNVVYWSTMNAWLPLARLESRGSRTVAVEGEAGDDDAATPLIPIYRLMRPVPTPSRILE